MNQSYGISVEGKLCFYITFFLVSWIQMHPPKTKCFNQWISMLKNKTWSKFGGWILLIQMVIPAQSCLLSPYLQRSIYNSSCTHKIICMRNITVLPYRRHRERWRSLCPHLSKCVRCYTAIVWELAEVHCCVVHLSLWCERLQISTGQILKLQQVSCSTVETDPEWMHRIDRTDKKAPRCASIMHSLYLGHYTSQEEQSHYISTWTMQSCS